MGRSITQMSPLGIGEPLAISGGGTGKKTVDGFLTTFDPIKQSDLGTAFNSPVLDQETLVPVNNLPSLSPYNDELCLYYPRQVVNGYTFDIIILNADINLANNLTFDFPNGYGYLTDRYSVITANISQVGETAFTINGVEYPITVLEQVTYVNLSGPTSGDDGVVYNFTSPEPDLTGRGFEQYGMTVYWEVSNISDMSNIVQAYQDTSFIRANFNQLCTHGFSFGAGVWYVRASFSYNGEWCLISNPHQITISGTNTINDGGGGSTQNP